MFPSESKEGQQQFIESILPSLLLINISRDSCHGAAAGYLKALVSHGDAAATCVPARNMQSVRDG